MTAKIIPFYNNVYWNNVFENSISRYIAMEWKIWTNNPLYEDTFNRINYRIFKGIIVHSSNKFKCKMNHLNDIPYLLIETPINEDATKHFIHFVKRWTIDETTSMHMEKLINTIF